MEQKISNIKIVEAPENKFPRCPYCKEELDTVWAKVEGIGWAGQERILMCPHCESLLGFTVWKKG